jgi:tRNA pseudouridine38-40 synthase
MQNLRLRLEYDGTDFKGWQIQPEERTVQGVLEAAITQITGEVARVLAAGRTDTGVHALDQVVNFSYAGARTPEQIARSLNGVLPPDVSILTADAVPADFHARFDAKHRVYQYRLTTRRLAVGRLYAWWVRANLEIDAMNRAASCLVGHHDFTSFCVAAQERDSRDCDVTLCTWRKLEPDTLVLDIEANRFVRSMVRGIVGTLVDVGRGTIAEAEVATILAAKDRRKARATAPPAGLFLKRVDYEV